MNGFLKFYEAGIIDSLPKIIGVQSEHADPVFQYYLEPDADKREFKPVNVKSSVAQAAMIGNPVSMPRVIKIADLYNKTAKEKKIYVVQVKEQAIMDWQLQANRNGHIACTQGGESLAGLVEAVKQQLILKNEIVIIDSTAHAMKFSGFQELYFEKSIPKEYNIESKSEFINAPQLIMPDNQEKIPGQGSPLSKEDFKVFAEDISQKIAARLNLKTN